MSWHSIKEQIIRTVGMRDDVLHVHVGMLIYLVAAMLFAASRRRWLWAFLVVCAVEFLNEGLDVIDWLNRTSTPNWRNGLRDIGHTLLWPGILTIVLSRRRS